MPTRGVWACLAVLVFLTSTLAAEPEGVPFSVEIVDHSERTVLGLPVRGVTRLSNQSEASQPTAFLHAFLKIEVIDGPPEAMACLAGDRARRGAGGSEAGGLVPDLVSKKTASVSPGWSTDVDWSLLLPEPGTYTLVSRFSMTQGREQRVGEPDDNWVGEVQSTAVTVRVLEPAGVDKEVFERYSTLVPEGRYCSPAMRYMLAFEIPYQFADKTDLVRRYPGSTYAADQVQGRYLQVWPRFDPEHVIRSRVARPLEDAKGRVPCPPPEQCLESGEIYLRGADYIGWMLGWCDRILEGRPETSLAQEVRYARAVYRCRIGDTGGCVADLTELIERGRPYVAAQARELLSALKAEGILEESAR